MKKLCLLIAFLSSFSSFGQSFKALEKAGDKAFKERDYYAAMYYYADALELKPKEAGINFKYAEVARHFSAFEKAEKHYQKVLKSKESSAFPLTNFHLGQICQGMGKYEEAILHYREYLSMSGAARSAEADEALKNCEWAQEDGPIIRIVCCKLKS